MSEEKQIYDVDPQGAMHCARCGVPLEAREVVFEYLDNAFQVRLPVCPSCGFIYVPEELAEGKVLSVEKILEDK